MPRALPPLFAVLAALPALAEAPAPADTPTEPFGSAAQLVLAQQTYLDAIASGEVRPLLTAMQLARAVTLRPAPGWLRTATGEMPPDAPVGAARPPDPAGEAALTIARNLAGDDPDLQDLVWDLDAQFPDPRSLTAVEVRADLAPGETDEWRLPLFGQVPAEIGLIGDGDGPLEMTVLDEGGAPVCPGSASSRPALCRLTPERNGFFTVSVRNSGGMVNSYRLIGN
jgi:hypothetical protein